MNHSSHPTRNTHSQRAQRIVCGAPFSSIRLRQPGHTAYLSPQCAGRLLASCGRATIVQCWGGAVTIVARPHEDRKSTRLNSSHLVISYAVFCLKKKKNTLTNVSSITVVQARVHRT